MVGICPKCGNERELTRDHIVPQWIYKRIPWKQLGLKKNLGENNIQLICSKCNSEKGGAIDTSEEVGRVFWTAVRDAIDKELKKSEF